MDDGDLDILTGQDLNSTVLETESYKRPQLLDNDPIKKFKESQNNNLVQLDYPLKVNDLNQNTASNHQLVKNQAVSNDTRTNSTIVHTILNDLSNLKKKFGCFELFNKDSIEPESWFALVKDYLDKNYSDSNPIIKCFYVFLSEEFHNWFFKLNITNLVDLEEAFLKECTRIRLETSSLSLLSQDEFIIKLKTKYATDNQVIKSINASPTYSYFKYKWYYLNKSFSSLSASDLLKISITLLEEDTLKQKMIEYRQLSLKDFLVFCKHIDITQKSI